MLAQQPEIKILEKNRPDPIVNIKVTKSNLPAVPAELSSKVNN